MPRRMQVEFSAIVQRVADDAEAEIPAAELWALFERNYFTPWRAGGRWAYVSHSLHGASLRIDLQRQGRSVSLHGSGSDALDALADALGLPLRVDSLVSHPAGTDSQPLTWALVEASAPGVAGSRFGAARHADVSTAALLALLSAVGRLEAAGADGFTAASAAAAPSAVRAC